MIGLGPLIWDPSLVVDQFFPNWGQPNQPGESVSGYPTDFTRDVIPMPCHSHNDYWRRVPLFEAIHYGCIGVEADVWLFDEELFVGHTTASLTKNRTLKSLYVDPLVNILDTMNAEPAYGSNIARKNVRGVFEEAPQQTLVLLIDFKMDGREQFPVVSSHLEALREKGYLTHYNGQEVVERPVTVVATGNAPLDLITANSTYRDIFFDAPLDRLYENPKETSPPPPALPQKSSQGSVGTSSSSDFNPSNSFYASVSFTHAVGFVWRGHLSPAQMDIIRGQIRGAQRRGLKARYWDTPSWPVGLRNHVWHVLMKEGADMLNVDDLKSAAVEDWTVRRHRGIW